MSAGDLTQKDIERIIEIIKTASDISEFSLKYGGTEIHISREGRQPHSQPAPLTSSFAEKLPDASAPAGPKTPAPHTTVSPPLLTGSDFTVDAPMVGTFYRAPAPGEAPFVEVGQAVDGETVLCIIEVMKLMNSISARRKGRIKEILVQDGEPVEFGQPLIILEADD